MSLLNVLAKQCSRGLMHLPACSHRLRSGYGVKQVEAPRKLTVLLCVDLETDSGIGVQLLEGRPAVRTSTMPVFPE